MSSLFKIKVPLFLFNLVVFMALLAWIVPMTGGTTDFTGLLLMGLIAAAMNLALFFVYRYLRFSPLQKINEQFSGVGIEGLHPLSKVGDARTDLLVERYNDVLNQLRESRETSEYNRQQNKQLLEINTSSEAKSRALLNSSLDAIVTANSDGEIIDFNTHAEAIFGWQKAEILGKQLSDTIIPERYRHMHNSAMGRFDKNKESKLLNRRIELVALHKQGHEFNIEIAICTVENGNDVFFAAFIRDITEQKRLQMDSLLASCVFNINIPMFVADHEAKIVKANAAFLSTLGFDEGLPENFKATRLFYDEDKSVREQMWNALDAKGDWAKEVTIVKADDSHFPAHAHASVIKGEQAKENLYVCELNDISERREYVNKLKEARVLAEQASEAKGRFLATMSHEIRTPMNAVLGILELLEEDNVHPEQLKLIHLAMSSGTQLMEIINSILDLSRMNAGTFTISPKPFCTASLIDSTRGIMQTAASEKNLALQFQVSPALPAHICGDFTRIRQILINLIDNAIKFTDKGSIAISLSAVSHNNETFELLCDVTDSGIGIDESFKDQLFDEFSMADNSSSRQRSGAGLGLSICKNLVKKMSGHITARNNRSGGGAQFSFSIRLNYCTEDEIAALRTVSKHDNLHLPKGCRVLVAEDNESNRLIAENQLIREDIQLVFAENGKQACDLCQEQQFDVILMDISMPEMDGIAATQQIIGAGGLNAETPIVALTAHSMENEINRFLASGMRDHLSKPCTKKCLFEKINKWCLGVPINQEETAEMSPQSSLNVERPVVTPVVESKEFDCYKLFDHEVLNRLIYDTSREVVPRLLEVYLSETRKIADTILAANEQGDLEKIEFAAHSIKSSSASHANMRLHEVSKAIESLCATGKADEVAFLVGLFEGITEDSLRVTQQVLDEMNESAVDCAEQATPVR